MTQKVWGFNCYGICQALISLDRIDAYNEKHADAASKIVSWIPYERQYAKEGE